MCSCEWAISSEACRIGNATESAEKPNQAGHPRTNRVEAAPAERKINRGHSQGYPHQQLNSSPRNQSTTYRRQSRQSTINNKIISLFGAGGGNPHPNLLVKYSLLIASELRAYITTIRYTKRKDTLYSYHLFLSFCFLWFAFCLTFR